MDSSQQATENLLALIPQAIPLDVLENYGLTVSISQAETLSAEILSLTMFWIKDALSTGLTADYGKRIWGEVIACLAEEWDKKFGFETLTPSQFLQEMEETHAAWEKIRSPGIEPIMLFTYAANQLETRGILPSNDHQNVIALFLDFVPVDEIGEVASAIEQGLS